MRERVKRPPSPMMTESFWKPKTDSAVDHRFSHELWIHLVHVHMLEKQGIVSSAHCADISAVIAELEGLGAGVLEIDGTIEDLYSYTERYLARRLGPDVGGRLHTGRSRNDLGATSGRMVLRETMLRLLGEFARLRQVVLDLAEDHRETVMPGYTHCQHAQPITMGYYFLAFADHLQRDWHRCVAALRHTNQSPLGAGALAGTSFPLDRAYCAENLAFDGLVETAYDAVSSRDDGQEATAALAVLMTAVSRLAVDMQSWSTQEFGFVELADEHSSVSSIMPQKKNPICLEHLRAEAARVTGCLTAALAVAKNTTFAEVIDGAAGVETPAREAAEITTRSLRLMTEVLERMSVFPERMAISAARGFGTATELADTMVRDLGLSFRTAHNIVAAVVAKAIGNGKRADQITVSDVSEAGQAVLGRQLDIPEASLRQALDPVLNVARRDIAGGPAPHVVGACLRDRRKALSDDRATVEAMQTRIRESRAAVFARVRAGGPG